MTFFGDGRFRDPVNGALFPLCFVIAYITQVDEALSACVLVFSYIFPVIIVSICYSPCPEIIALFIYCEYISIIAGIVMCPENTVLTFRSCNTATLNNVFGLDRSRNHRFLEKGTLGSVRGGFVRDSF